MQKPALKSVNVQRTGKSILQMFAFSFFDGSHICRFLPILRPPTVPRSHFRYTKIKVFILIISHLYLQIVTSASANNLNQLAKNANTFGYAAVSESVSELADEIDKIIKLIKA